MMRMMRTATSVHVSLLLLLLSSLCFQLLMGARFHHLSSASSHSAARKFLRNAATPNGLLRCIPALNMMQSSSSSDKQQASSVVEVSTTTTTTTKSTKTKTNKRSRIVFLQDLSGALPPLLSSSGIYYGVSPQTVQRYYDTAAPRSSTKKKAPQKKKRVGLKETMTETLDELKSMRQEMEALRRELHRMKQQVEGSEDEEEMVDEYDVVVESEEDRGVAALMKRRKRQRHFDKIGNEVERWAEKLLFEQDGEQDGWTKVECNKMFRSSLNSDGRTRAYLKWMTDPRGKHANKDDDREYPCIKMYSTIDAPLEDVCLYLSQQQRLEEYNDLIVRHRDVEEVSPHAKICWGRTPQILFIKPRELVTYCQHRWLRDGTQVVVNQACDHKDVKPNDNPRAYALRGANFISRDPDDPEKTRISMLAHANPGADVPQWACKTAVNALAPIEPFKLFHKINEGVKKCRPELERRLDETEMVSMPGRTTRPAGLAQMGYACFWPHGGGPMEGVIHPQHPDHSHGPPPEGPPRDDDESSKEEEEPAQQDGSQATSKSDAAVPSV